MFKVCDSGWYMNEFKEMSEAMQYANLSVLHGYQVSIVWFLGSKWRTIEMAEIK